MTTSRCPRTAETTGGLTCVEALADGWITPQDLCPACTRAYMKALDTISGPLLWHENFHRRAEGTGTP